MQNRLKENLESFLFLGGLAPFIHPERNEVTELALSLIEWLQSPIAMAEFNLKSRF